jgi:NADH-quinone oxidoreductase subunit N
MLTADIATVLPELLLALAGLGLLMFGVFQKGDATRVVSVLAILSFAAALLVMAKGDTQTITAFGGLIQVDRFTVFAKGLILLAAAFTTAMSVDFLEKEKIGRFEYPVLIVLSTLGMMVMVSSGDFLTLYLGLELQSLPLYVLAAYNRDSLRATEAGVKYFVLGALASGLLLYGISLVYGFSGTTQFSSLATVLATPEGAAPNMGVVIGMVFILAGLAFKISAVPFHMWTPDVYEGAPTSVTAFFAVTPKIAAFTLLIRVLEGPFGQLGHQWQQIIVVVSLLSMFVGSFGALGQNNIKRLLAYSSIGHVGFALVGVAAGQEMGIQGVLVYLAIYLFMNIGAFAIVMLMRRKGVSVEGVDDLAGLSKTHPVLAYVMAGLMFSMAGIPPLAGFWGKFYVFMAAVQAGLWTLSIIGLLTSVVSAFYYLRVIKVMFMDEPNGEFDRHIGKPAKLVLVLSTAVIVLFSIFPGPLLSSAKVAAQVLFPG